MLDGTVTDADSAGLHQWQDADLVSALLCLDPAGLAGVTLHAAPGPARDRWIEILKARSEPSGPVLRVPANISEDRLLGGLDLSATLAAGRPVLETGLLCKADGGVLLVSMAERLERRFAAHIATALDTGEVRTERAGLSDTCAARFAVILLDEHVTDEDPPPALLTERLAFQIPLAAVSQRDLDQPVIGQQLLDDARMSLPDVRIGDELARAMDETALRFGVDSLRTVHLSLRATRAIAALDGAATATDRHAALAARLVLAPRVTQFAELTPPDEPDAPPPQNPENKDGSDADPSAQTGPMEDRLIDAVRLACSLRLAQRPVEAARNRSRNLETGSGRSGMPVESLLRGQRIGTRPGDPRRGGRLDLIATLQAAAPWQGVRGRGPTARLRLSPDDFRLRRHKAHAASVVIFVVDASGSLAMNRMAEAKGAVELLLSDCYTRRDFVALVAFRKEGAELMLPPTRSLTRVRRSLGTLPGGGGTPVAAGLASALRLAGNEQARGRTPYIVVLSDGSANISLAGDPGREQASQDALDMARRIRAAGYAGLFLDTSRRSNPKAVEIASEMGGAYQLLPVADSQTVSKSVRRLVGP